MPVEHDVICRDAAGMERFVGFGSDLPKGWEIVRFADDTSPHLAAGAELPAGATQRRVGDETAGDDPAATVPAAVDDTAEVEPPAGKPRAKRS